MVMTTTGILREVAEERERQKVLWSEKHDSAHTLPEWMALLACLATRSMQGVDADDFRRDMVKVAATAVAALENFDRKEREHRELWPSTEESAEAPAVLEDLKKLQTAAELLLQVPGMPVCLVGLDKTILLGGLPPRKLSPETRKKLEECRVKWDAELEAWTFYTGR